MPLQKIRNNQMGTDSVSSENIIQDTLTKEDIATGGVGTDEIEDYSVHSIDIADDAILSRHLSSNIVLPEHLDLYLQSGVSLNYTETKRLISASNQINLWTKFNPTNKLRDPLNEFNITTGIFTAQSRGIYAAYCDLYINFRRSTLYFYVAVFVNGVLSSIISESQVSLSGLKRIVGSGYVNVAQGDTVEFYFYSEDYNCNLEPQNNPHLFLLKVV